MVKIYYPQYPFKIKEEPSGRELIFDELRKIWVRLSDEEWVRQNFVQYLLQVKQYPAAYIAIERLIKLGELNKRFDILVFNSAAQPWMLVECKATAIPLDKAVLWQILHYNIALPVKYLVITNGRQCFAYARNDLDFESIPFLPTYDQ